MPTLKLLLFLSLSAATAFAADTWQTLFDGKTLAEKKIDAIGMVKYGEGFFTSLGFAPLPETFWKRSLFVKPADRDMLAATVMRLARRRGPHALAAPAKPQPGRKRR